MSTGGERRPRTRCPRRTCQVSNPMEPDARDDGNLCDGRDSEDPLLGRPAPVDPVLDDQADADGCDDWRDGTSTFEPRKDQDLQEDPDDGEREEGDDRPPDQGEG